MLDHLPWRRWRALPPRLAPHPETKSVVREHGCAELMSPLWTSKAAASRYSTSSPEGLFNGNAAMGLRTANPRPAPASRDPRRWPGQDMVPSRGAWKSRGPHFALRAPLQAPHNRLCGYGPQKAPLGVWALKRPATAPQPFRAAAGDVRARRR